MRVIEPPYHRKRRPKRLKSSKAVILFLAVALLGLGGWYAWNSRRSASKPTSQHSTASETQATPTQTVTHNGTSLKTLTNQEFRDLYAAVAKTYPNIQEVTVLPPITGQPAADQHIRAIAERRGYQLRSLPVAPIIKINESGLEGDDLLQAKAFEGWQALKTAAAADKVPLHLLSAYRSVEYQRNLFMQRLTAAGVTVDNISGGGFDTQINQVLSLTAPPGYSRHHNGYTIDLACYPNGQFVQFATSSCFRWISANNYEKAKQAGWLPSYPAGTTDQGPEPEPWEYVWVGKDVVSQ